MQGINSMHSCCLLCAWSACTPQRTGGTSTHAQGRGLKQHTALACPSCSTSTPHSHIAASLSPPLNSTMAHARTDREQREHDVINRAHDRRVEKVKRLVQVVHLGQDAADNHLEGRKTTVMGSVIHNIKRVSKFIRTVPAIAATGLQSWQVTTKAWSEGQQCTCTQHL